MADDADLADGYTQAMIARGIAAATRHATYENQMIEGGIVVCLDCDEPIASARLQALPKANRCIACQRALEGDR